MQHKRSLIRAVFLCLSAAFTGCPSGSAVVTQPPPPYRGVQLRVACPDAKTKDLLETYSPNWANQQQGRVHTVRYDAADTPPDADLWVIPAVELPRLAHAGLLRPLPDQYTGDRNSTWMDLLPLYREQLVAWDQKRYGFPLLGEAPVCVYRSDLFAAAKLAPPQTWEQFAEAAEHFRAHGPGGRAGPRLPPLPADDDGLEREFYTIAAGYAKQALPEGTSLEGKARAEVYSFDYDLETGKPRIDAPGFVYALRLMKDRLQPCRSKEATTDRAAAFRAGKAVLCLTDAGQLVSLQDPKKSAVAGQFAVCRMPGAGVRFDYATGEERPAGPQPNRLPYLGAGDYLAVVPQRAAAPQAAFALAAELCGRETSRQIFLQPGLWDCGPIRVSQLDDARLWDVFELDAARTTAMRDALRQTLLHPDVQNPALRLRTPDRKLHQTILVTAVREVLEGKQDDPAAALKAVAQRWAELDAKNPGHLAEYRMSLGLLPR